MRTRRRLASDILVMQASEDRKRNDRSCDAGRAMDRRIFVQAQVRARVIVVMGIETKNLPEVTLAGDQEVSRAADSHRRALAEPYVSLSTHTAPSIRAFA
jgi:hypothetical protein